MLREKKDAIGRQENEKESKHDYGGKLNGIKAKEEGADSAKDDKNA